MATSFGVRLFGMTGNFILETIFFLFLSVLRCNSIDIDSNGYIMYCPCMGRFGNQADHFLGALGFAHGLNRTLILPPWVEYRPGYTKSTQVPFDTYFKVESLQKFHRVLTMEYFMKNLAPSIWPPGNRTVFCFTSRGNSNDCNAKDGNPFGPFWDTFNVDFDYSEFYSPLNYDIYYHNMADKWNKRYPPEKFPVLAFTGAPASFPVQKENRDLHQYLEWSDDIKKKATKFIKSTLPPSVFVGIHLRNGIDWNRACEHIQHSPLLFSAPQCLGYNNEHGFATNEICFPTKETILKQLKRVVKAVKARSVFVASDNDHMIASINDALKSLKIKAFKQDKDDPHVDLAVLGQSNHFIGNCISSFSAFAKRERDVNSLPSSFWAFPAETKKKELDTVHDEF